MEAVFDGPVGREAPAVAISILMSASVAKSLEHVAGIELGLAVSQLAVVRLVRANEAKVDRIEVQEFVPLGNPLEQQAVPVLRARKAFALNGQGFGVPVREY